MGRRFETNGAHRTVSLFQTMRQKNWIDKTLATILGAVVALFVAYVLCLAIVWSGVVVAKGNLL